MRTLAIIAFAIMAMITLLIIGWCIRLVIISRRESETPKQNTSAMDSNRTTRNNR